jgi:hypothetical protein
LYRIEELFLGELRSQALVHESECGANDSSIERIRFFIAKDFALPRSNIRFRMLHAISASAFCGSG